MSLLEQILGPGHQLIQPEGGCHSCPLADRKANHFVPSTTPGNAKLIVVGEGPGRDEVAQNEGWVGRAGQHLRQEFSVAGITSFDYTNCVHCRPPNNETPNDRAVRACLNQYVKDEVKGYPIVVLAGNSAAKAFFPGVNPQKLRGNAAFHPDYPGQRFYTMYHPAYAIRGRNAGQKFTKQVRRLARILEEPVETPWRLWTTADGAAAWDRYEAMLRESFLSGDLETDGTAAWNPRTVVKSLAVANDTEEAVFWYRKDPEWEDAVRLLCKYLEKTSNTFLGHNIGFDVAMLRRRTQYRPTVRCQIMDTMPLLYLARQERQIGLKQATAKYGDGYRFLVHAPHKCEDVNQLGPYNSEDVIRPIELVQKFYGELEPDTKDLWLRVSSPTSVSLARVSADGIGYSMETAEQLNSYNVQRRNEELAAWKEEDPSLDLDFDLNGKAIGQHAGEGLREYIYSPEYLDLPVEERTETKLPSTAKDTIKGLVRQHDRAAPLEHLLAIKKIQKEQDTYVLPYIRGDRTSSDGRVHSSYTFCYTDTGRPSSRSPNLQNVTRPDRDRNVNLRDCFVARDGHLLVQWDFSQIELRIAMCLARDPVGIEAYRSGSDLHSATGTALAKLAGRDEMTKKDRQDAKPVNFANIYGGSAYTLQRYAASAYGVVFSDKKAQEYVDAFFGTYERLPLWHESVKRELAAGSGVLKSVMGHPASYPDWNSQDKGRREHAERAAINMTCQSPAAYITFYTMYLAQRAVDEVPHLRDHVLWCNTVYDSVMCDIHPRHVEEVDGLMRRAVGTVERWISDWFVVPLIIDRSQGPDWGHLKEIEE